MSQENSLTFSSLIDSVRFLYVLCFVYCGKTFAHRIRVSHIGQRWKCGEFNGVKWPDMHNVHFRLFSYDTLVDMKLININEIHAIAKLCCSVYNTIQEKLVQNNFKCLHYFNWFLPVPQLSYPINVSILEGTTSLFILASPMPIDTKVITLPL